jgi:hypothetical protein
MTNPTPRDSSARKVVAAARQIVTYQIGLPMGSRRVIGAWSPLLKDGLALRAIFEDYMKQVTGLPIGSERLEWDRDVLAEKDRTLERINAEWRDRIFGACWALIDLLAANEVG